VLWLRTPLMLAWLNLLASPSPLRLSKHQRPIHCREPMMPSMVKQSELQSQQPQLTGRCPVRPSQHLNTNGRQRQNSPSMTELAAAEFCSLASDPFFTDLLAMQQNSHPTAPSQHRLDPIRRSAFFCAAPSQGAGGSDAARSSRGLGRRHG